MSDPTSMVPPPSRPRVPWPIALGLALAAIAAAGLFSTLQRRAAPLTGVETGGGAPAAPAFRLASLDGRQLGPADFAGQVVLVDFWATWCGPCRMQAEVLAGLHRTQHGRPVQFLAVSVGEEEATVRQFAQENPFEYPVLLDPGSRVADSFEVMALPTIVVLDRHGRVVLKESGLTDAATIEKALAAAASS
ncbi:MAG: TlpA family protein disulfide reductase [Holophagales bacterium]|nr:MAG: TlpA family protein disulfide reductase [Holophagales bacterium]